RHVALAYVERDTLRIPLERVAIATPAGRADHDDAPLLEGMPRDFAGRVEILDGTVPVDPGPDRDSRQAAQHAEGRDDSAVREQRIARSRGQHAQGALHRQ